MLALPGSTEWRKVQPHVSVQTKEINEEARSRSLLNKFGIHVPDSAKLTKQQIDVVRLFKELQSRAGDMQLPDALVIFNKLHDRVSGTSARCIQSVEDKVCILIKLSLVLCNTRSLEAAIQLASLPGNAFDLDKPHYEDYVCTALNGASHAISQRYTTLLSYRELRIRELRGKGKITKAQVISTLAEEVASRRPNVSHEKVKSLLRNCDSRSKMWQSLSSIFNGDGILCLIVAKEKGMTTSQMQEIPNTFATAFAHVAHELLHDDLAPILNALKKDRPATLKTVAKNITSFGTVAERRNRPLLRRDWEELSEQNMGAPYPPTSAGEPTQLVAHYGNQPSNEYTFSFSGLDPWVSERQLRQDLEQEPIAIQQTQEPTLCRNHDKCFDEELNPFELAFSDYLKSNYHGSPSVVQQSRQEHIDANTDACEQYNYRRHPTVIAEYGGQSLGGPTQPPVNANVEFALEDSRDSSNYCGLFDEYDSSFARFSQ